MHAYVQVVSLYLSQQITEYLANQIVETIEQSSKLFKQNFIDILKFDVIYLSQI